MTTDDRMVQHLKEKLRDAHATNADLRARLGDVEALEQRERARRQALHPPISGLVRLLYKLGEEHARALAIHLNEDKHRSTRLTALEQATRARKRQVEAFEGLLSHPKETLLENDDFLELQEDDVFDKLNVVRS